jgi:hypothetical protein
MLHLMRLTSTHSGEQLIEANLRDASAHLRAWGAVVLVGAGMSVSRGFPTVGQLPELVWHSLDSVPDAAESYARKVGVEMASAKQMVGYDPARLRSAYSLIQRHASAQMELRRTFSRLDRERAWAPSPAHDALAELIHRGRADQVISLNWDTCLESAYLRRYGQPLVPDAMTFAKPHGDAAHPDRPWVLPYQSKRLSMSVRRRLASLVAERPRTLLVVGYSGADDDVERDLTGPLQHRWHIVRLGPSATGQHDIALPAEEALPKLVRLAFPEAETPGWEHVTFSSGHDLAPALWGYRLGPADARTLPPLNEVDAVVERLRTVGYAWVVGPSGGGKSITGYQAAYRLSVEGWEVIRMSDVEDPRSHLVDALTQTSRRTVVLVDDAQHLSPSTIRALTEATRSNLLVLVLSTEPCDDPNAQIAISQPAAVTKVMQFYLGHLTEIGTLLRVRSPSSAEAQATLRRRLVGAVDSQTPWDVAFLLRGGEEQWREVLATLRDTDRADLYLSVIAMGQLVGADRAIAAQDLPRLLHPLGRSANWATDAAAALRSQGLLAGDGQVRTHHARYAAWVLGSTMIRRGDPERERLWRVLHGLLTSQETSYLGLRWLLLAIPFAELLNWLRRPSVAWDQVLEALLDRCWAAPHEDAGHAVQILEFLALVDDRAMQSLAAHAEQLLGWCQDPPAGSLSAFDRLARRCSDALDRASHGSEASLEAYRTLRASVFDRVDAMRLVQHILELPLREGVPWADLLVAVRIGASREWRRSLAALIEEGAFATLLGKATPADMMALARILWAVWVSNRTVGTMVLRKLTPRIGRLLSRNWPVASSGLYELGLGILGFNNILSRPTSDQLAACRLITRHLDFARLAHTLATHDPHMWPELLHLVSWLRQVDRPTRDRFLDSLDLAAISPLTNGLWHRPTGEFDDLLRALAGGLDHYGRLRPLHGRSRASELAQLHRDEAPTPNVLLAICAPEVTAFSVRSGQQLDLRFGSEETSRLAFPAAEALWSLDRVDPGATELALESNAGEIARYLEGAVWDSDWERHAALLVRVLERHPASLARALARVDPSAASTHWRTYNRSTQYEMKRVMRAASRHGGAIASVADSILDRPVLHVEIEAKSYSLEQVSKGRFGLRIREVLDALFDTRDPLIKRSIKELAVDASGLVTGDGNLLGQAWDLDETLLNVIRHLEMSAADRRDFELRYASRVTDSRQAVSDPELRLHGTRRPNYATYPI